MFNIYSLPWINVKDRPLTSQDFHKELIIKYRSPVFPGSKDKQEDMKLHFAFGKICASNSTQGEFAAPLFFFTGVPGHPSMQVNRILEYIFF